MSPRQRRIRLSVALREPQNRPLSGANGKPARAQHRDREVFQLHSAEVSDREERPAFEGSAGYPEISQGELTNLRLLSHEERDCKYSLCRSGHSTTDKV